MSHIRMPSTPNARSTRTAQSTTPAGPPPTHITNPSTTPAGPPPRSSLFDSSIYPTNRTFPSKQPAAKQASFEVPSDDEYDEDEDAEGDTEDYMDDLPPQSFPQSSFMSSLPPSGSQSLKRSRGPRAAIDEGKATKMRKILEGQVHNRRPAKLTEPDAVILGTERVLADLTEKIQRRPVEADSYLAESSAQLTGLWSREASTATKSGSVGPKSKDPLSQANYLASLFLQLHHPHSQKASPIQSRNSRASVASRPSFSVPLPKALLDWLNTYHMPFPDDYEAIRLNEDGPSAHEAFWDVVFANALRGKLDRVVDLLQNAEWEHAYTAPDDDPAQVDGYRGYYLETTLDAADVAVKLLKSCPGLQDNWDVKGMEWSIFRSRVQLAVSNLAELAGQDLDDMDASQNEFQRSGRLDLSTASRRASSRLPPTVAENLNLLYRLLLGSYENIMMVSQDWLEASLYLTAWWDGTDEEELGRSSMRKSTTQKPRTSDIAPLESYRKRLRESFLKVTTQEEEPAFQVIQEKKAADERTAIEAAVNTSEPVLTGLACLLANECPGAVVDLLQSYSQTLAVAVVEMGSLGHWLPLYRPRMDETLANNFSSADLMGFPRSVNGQRSNGDDVDRDDFLMEYAERLAEKPQVEDQEGWELAVAILNRLDQAEQGQTRILNLLETLELADEGRVDNILGVCDQFNLVEQRRAVAERFADSLAEAHSDYGAAIVYYARAHADFKLKETISILTSLCLLHSVAHPVQQLLDPKLAALLSKDRQALRELARTDPDAASALALHLSGYATLRKFYDLRDQDVYMTQGHEIDRSLKSLERRRQAASALFAVIKSSADCITGGLYDPDVESVVPVDGLLALFGEALPLLGQEQRIFTESQIFSLLTIIEDFVASPSRIRENADSLLSSSLTAYKEGVSTASGIFKKSKSDLSASSSWDMLASKSTMEQSESLGKNAKIQRAWDWRQGLVGMGMSDTDSKAVIKLVREALIREVAAGWAGKLNW